MNLNLIWPQEERLAACIDESIGIVHFFWGGPSELIRKAHAGGLVVMQPVGTAAEARKAADAGPPRCRSFEPHEPECAPWSSLT